MKATFKQFTIAAAGTPQPLIGTTIAGAASIATDPMSAQGSQQSVQVTDSSMFKVGDWSVFDVGVNEERVRIENVPDATHIKVSGLIRSHGVGIFVRLSNLCQSVYVQTKKVNAGSIFIGTQGMNKTGAVKVIVELIPVGAGIQPIDWSDPVRIGADGSDVGDFWIDGNTNDGYLPSLTVL